MSRWLRIAILLIAGLVAVQWWSDRAPVPIPPGGTPLEAAAGMSKDPAGPAWLPPEALVTLQAIERGGPFPYDRDGSLFQNRERRLPERPRGYYREYTVDTPGSPDRGARRIVAGGDPPEVFYYTDDHYRTFRRLDNVP